MDVQPVVLEGDAAPGSGECFWTDFGGSIQAIAPDGANISAPAPEDSTPMEEVSVPRKGGGDVIVAFADVPPVAATPRLREAIKQFPPFNKIIVSKFSEGQAAPIEPNVLRIYFHEAAQGGAEFDAPIKYKRKRFLASKAVDKEDLSPADIAEETIPVLFKDSESGVIVEIAKINSSAQKIDIYMVSAKGEAISEDSTFYGIEIVASAFKKMDFYISSNPIWKRLFEGDAERSISPLSVDSAREYFIGFIGEIIDTMQKKLKELEKNAADNLSLLAAIEADRADTSLALWGYERAKAGEPLKEIEEEFARVLSHPWVDSAYIEKEGDTNRAMMVLTKDIEMRSSVPKNSNGEAYPTLLVGRFHIRIPFTKDINDVSIVNVSGQRFWNEGPVDPSDGEGRKLNHPHIETNPCYGTAGPTLTKLKAHRQYGGFFSVLMSYLGSYNPRDTLGKRYVAWEEYPVDTTAEQTDMARMTIPPIREE